MRLAGSLALVIFLAGPALPVAAQQNARTVGPIARSITREAARVATVQQSKPVDSEWLRVRKLAPGMEIIVTVKGSPPAQRYFVAGNESELTVLTLTDPGLPPAVRDVLREMASNHPGYFPAAQKGGTFLLEKNLRVAPDGVFVADRKVADLRQVVEQIDRHDVAEIRRANVGSNALGCVLTGYFLGSFAGGFAGGYIGAGVSRDKDSGFMRGMVVGMPIGATLVYLKCRHSQWFLPAEVIYRAP